MLFNPEKALIAWNNDNLDTYHDIVVSFDFARYSTANIPQGGFCVVFFESSQDVPTIGGPGASLGYTPNSQSDYCFNRGYQGFRGGFLGVGFDLNGEFGIKTDLVDGLDFPTQNSVTLRGSESENYKHISTSKNLVFTPVKFLVADKLNSLDGVKFRTIRIIASKAFTEIQVQVKNEKDKEFYTVLTTKLPIRKRTGVRVGITNIEVDGYTKFELKNFNVAGFPGVVSEPDLRDCATIIDAGTVQGKTIVSGEDFCAVPIQDSVGVYEIRDGSFSLRQFIQEEGPAFLIGGNDRFLFLNKKDTYEVDIYFKSGGSFLKTQTIDVLNEVFDVPEPLFGGFPECADTDNRFLIIGNKKNVFVYQFFTGISTFGQFSYLQTITDHPSGDVGYSVQIDNGKILTGGGKERLSGRTNSFVASYLYNGIAWDVDPAQTIVSPVSGNIYNEFGYSISMQGNEAIIGSPNERRRNRETLGHGDAYHFVYANNRRTGRREWRNAMALGNTFNIDCPGANFGTSVSFLGNNLLVSAPYENYLFPPDSSVEDNPNAGRVYLFRKSAGGTFSQAAILAPDPFRVKPYMFFGREVGFLGRGAAVVTVPYNSPLQSSEIDVYKVGCVFDLPPAHLPINIKSIALYDSSGYTIDIETKTYLQLLDTQL